MFGRLVVWLDMIELNGWIQTWGKHLSGSHSIDLKLSYSDCCLRNENSHETWSMWMTCVHGEGLFVGVTSDQIEQKPTRRGILAELI